MTLNGGIIKLKSQKPKDYKPYIYSSSGGFTLKHLNSVVRGIRKSSKSRLFNELMKGEVEIGDVIIASRYYKGHSIIKLKVVGETAQFWKVKPVNDNDYFSSDKLHKTTIVYILEHGS